MRSIVYLTILFISMPLLAEVNEDLQSQLIRMAQQNQQVRQSLEKYNTENVPPALQTLASQIGKLQTQTLKEIITLHGWPTKKKVGEKGTQAAFILVQHSKNLVFQQDMLPLIIQSFLDKGGIAGKDIAKFTDSVSIRLGKKQVFGTQAKWIDGKVVFAPIENEDSVNLLRAQMGMLPLEEYKKSLETFNLQKYR
jgi:hypothetical protein